MKSIALAMLVLALASGQPILAAEGKGNKAQTTRMSQCSADAKQKGLKGDARKEFMSQCLRNPGPQTAVKECSSNAAEKGLKGEQRKAFVDECVRTKASAASMG